MEFLKSKKGKIIIISVAVVIVIAVAAVLIVSNMNKGYRNICVSEVSGEVMTENNGNAYAAYENMRIGGGYALSTGTDSYTRMVLDDSKYVKLEQHSRALFEELGNDKKRNTVINVVAGTLVTEVAKPLNSDEGYIITTPNSIMAVRGTYFRVEVRYDENGDEYTDLYVYGGTVACKRIMPDGSIVDEEVLVPSGYKASIKMDRVITVYVEELIEDEAEKDNIDPMYISEIGDDDLVDIYNASEHGHKMFADSEKLWDEIEKREIDIDDHRSYYDGGKIKPLKEKGAIGDSAEDSSEITTTVSEAEPEELTTTETEKTTTTETEAILSEPASTVTEPVIISSAVSLSDSHTEVDAETEEADETEAPAETTEELTTTTEITTTTTAVTETVYAPITTPHIITAPITVIVTEASSVDTTESFTKLEEPETEEATTVLEEDIPAEEEDSEETEEGEAEIISPSDDEDDNVEYEEEDEDVEPMIPTTTPYTPPVIISTPPSSVITTIVTDTTTTTPATTTTTITTTTTTTTTTIPEITTTTTTTTTAVSEETETGLPVDEENFPDAVFRTYVSENFDTDASGYLSDKEIAAVTKIDVSGTVTSDGGVASLTGIEHFTGLETLECRYNKELAAINASKNTVLKVLECGATSISSLDVSANSSLCNLNCSETLITKLDLSGNKSLETLLCADTPIKELNLSENTLLKYLVCSGTEIIELDVGNNTKLMYLKCSETDIVELNLSNNTALEGLDCSNTNIFALDLSNNTALTSLRCFNTSISELDLSNNAALESLYCYNTSISNLDLSVNIALTRLECYNTAINKLDLSANTALKILKCGGCQLLYLDLTNNTNLTTLEADGNKYTIPSGTVFAPSSIDGFDPSRASGWTNCTYDEATGLITGITGDVTYTYDCGNGLTAVFTLTGTGEQTEGLPIDSESFPDSVFRAYISNNFDGDKNGYLSDAEIAEVKEINVNGNENTLNDGGITSLVGIEHFPNLTTLNCYYNKNLTSLDISSNTALTSLRCFCTPISSIDVSKHIALDTLHFGNTNVSEIDVSNNTALTFLDFGTTGISTVDLSKNTKLGFLNCGETPLTELDVSNNTELWYLNFNHTSIKAIDVSKNINLNQIHCYNALLTCADLSVNTKIGTFSANDNVYPIASNAVSFDTAELTGFDPAKVSEVTNAVFDAETGIFSDIVGDITYVYDCGQGFKPTFTLARTGEAIEGLAVDSTNFPDEVFRTYVSENFDKDSNGYLSDEEIEAVTEIDVSGDSKIRSLQGIEYFTALTLLDCSYTNISSIDISKNTVLTELNCYYCSSMTELDVSNNTALTKLYCQGTSIGELDISKNIALTNLACGYTGVTELVVSKNVALTYLSCHGTRITTLDISKNTALTLLDCSYTNISSIDISKNTVLTELNCYYCSSMTELDISNNTALTNLYCWDTGITELDVSKNTALTNLNCSETNITELDLSNNTALTNLYCNYTDLTKLDVSNNTALAELSCGNTGITELDVSKNTALTYLECSSSDLAYVDLANNTSITEFVGYGNAYSIASNATTFDTSTITGFDPTKVSDVAGADFDSTTGIFTNITGDITYTYDCGQGYSETFTLARTGEAIEGLAVDSTNFPDEVFRTYVSENFDKDSNGYLSDEEIEAVTEIEVSSTDISSLTGIENFTSLTYLGCDDTEITEIDVTKNTELAELYCHNAPITELDVSKNTALMVLDCGGTNITVLDVSGNKSLVHLYCGDTPITSLDLSNNKALTQVRCINSLLPYINLSNNTKLTSLEASGNKYKISTENCTVNGLDVTITTATTPSEGKYNFEIIDSDTSDAEKNGNLITVYMDLSQDFGAEAFEALYDYNGELVATDEQIAAACEVAVQEFEAAVNDTIEAANLGLESGVLPVMVKYSGNATIEALKGSKASAVMYIEEEQVIEEVLPLSGYLYFTAYTTGSHANGYEIKLIALDDAAEVTAEWTGDTLTITVPTSGASAEASMAVLIQKAIKEAAAGDPKKAFEVSYEGDDINNINFSIAVWEDVTVSGGENSFFENLSAALSTFDTSTITGFAPTKVSDVTGADFDASTGIFTNITGDITYTYDCGQGYSETFTLTLTG